MIANIQTVAFETEELSFEDYRKIVQNDYKIAVESRETSLLGRKEVLTGKAKFGIFGDGKELAQIAMAKVFKKGDWRAGYYRDQTFAFATGLVTIKQFFAQLYADPDREREPSSVGRQMNAHFASRNIDAQGNWLNQMEMINSSSDISTTGGQMPRLVGLAHASKLYRENPALAHLTHFSDQGNEVAFGSIGNAATSEGVFFETFNAAGVLQIPMSISVWDDGYGISVPNAYQTTKENISEVLKGFQRDDKGNGFEIYRVNGWDYAALCDVYAQSTQICRAEHVPVLIHVMEMTQPQGHSTSGSHERYKSKERLAWEKEFDCIAKMRQWMIFSDLATEEELKEIEINAKTTVKQAQKEAWLDYNKGFKPELEKTIHLLQQLSVECNEINSLIYSLGNAAELSRKELSTALRKALLLTTQHKTELRLQVETWYKELQDTFNDIYCSKLFTETLESPSLTKKVNPEYRQDAKMVDGREVLNACFAANFERDEKLVAFGEDLGKIGDVNQGFAGLQQKFGEIRIQDSGIREMTIMGQGIGMALRGLKPIAEIQYLDYLLYGLNVLSDDLASLSYRTKAGQKSPMIIRTRGHRLEGIWHTGSPIGMILGTLRGIHLCVPRDMTQAAGMYNTLLRGDEPALVIESLNGYRLKELMPSNVGDFLIPIGEAEILQQGTDITVVSYGSTLRIVKEAAQEIAKFDISVEVIDAQTLLPFDKTHICAQSLAKTNRLLVVDEDVPGGASAYILQQILEVQNGYFYLDGQPRTLTAKEHRTPYGTDGDYFTKPSTDDVIEVVYQMMSESNPSKFPTIFS